VGRGSAPRQDDGYGDSSKLMIYAICGILTLLATFAFYKFSLGWNGIPFMETPYQNLLGMGLPLFWNINRADIRNIGLTICILAMFLKSGWIGYACIGIAVTVIYMTKKKFLALWIPLCVIFFLIGAPGIYSSGGKVGADTGKRFAIYEYGLQRWHNVWVGEGFNSFPNLPENQAGAKETAVKPKDRWLNTMHSDILQLAFELGVIVAFGALVLLILPMLFVDIHSLIDRTILASYLCVLFQACFDFPFHRWHTGLFGLLIILLMYKQVFFRGKK
jgi:hypothetical protein